MGILPDEKSAYQYHYIDSAFLKKNQAILKSFSYFLGLVGFSLLCWRTFVLAKQYIILPRGGTTITLHVPFFPFMLLLAIASGILALMLLIDFVKALTEVNKR